MSGLQLVDLFLRHADKKDKREVAGKAAVQESVELRDVLAHLHTPGGEGEQTRPLTVGDLDHRLLTFTSAARPRKRCLHFQAASALFRASSNLRFLRDGAWPTAHPYNPIAQSHYAVPFRNPTKQSH